MASEKAGVAGIAGRYATALFELAEAGKDLDLVEVDLVRLRALLAANADFQRFVTSPVLSREDQITGMAAIGQTVGLSALVQRFLGVVAANRRLFVLSAVITVFLAKLARHRGEITAEVMAAHPLAEAQQAALTAALATAAGGHVRIALMIDPTLLGGLVVKVGPRMVDSSLRTKLQRLKIAMKGTG